MLFIQEKKPKRNTQSDSKWLSSSLTLSTFHIVEFLITCNKTFTCILSSCKELTVIGLLEFENNEHIIKMSFKIIMADFYS